MFFRCDSCNDSFPYISANNELYLTQTVVLQRELTIGQ